MGVLFRFLLWWPQVGPPSGLVFPLIFGGRPGCGRHYNFCHVGGGRSIRPMSAAGSPARFLDFICILRKTEMFRTLSNTIFDLQEALRAAASDLDLCGLLEASVPVLPSNSGSPSSSGGVVLQDKLITEASLGVISQLSTLTSSLESLSSILAAQQQHQKSAHGLQKDQPDSPGEVKPAAAEAPEITGVDVKTPQLPPDTACKTSLAPPCPELLALGAKSVGRSPPVATDHCYSLSSDASSAAALQTLQEDIEGECYPAIPITDVETAKSAPSRPEGRLSPFLSVTPNPEAKAFQSSSPTFRDIIDSKPSWEDFHEGNVVVLKTESESMDMDNEDSDDDNNCDSDDDDSDSEQNTHDDLQTYDCQNMFSAKSWNSNNSFDINMLLGLEEPQTEEVITESTESNASSVSTCSAASDDQFCENPRVKTVHLVSPREILSLNDIVHESLDTFSLKNEKKNMNTVPSSHSAGINKIGIHTLRKSDPEPSNKVVHRQIIVPSSSCVSSEPSSLMTSSNGQNISLPSVSSSALRTVTSSGSGITCDNRHKINVSVAVATKSGSVHRTLSTVKQSPFRVQQCSTFKNRVTGANQNISGESGSNGDRMQLRVMDPLADEDLLSKCNDGDVSFFNGKVVQAHSSSASGFSLPPTPPSYSSSDSDSSGLSPERSQPLYETLSPHLCSPRRSHARHTSSVRHPIHTPLISCQPKGATGTLQLTDEEKRTLVSEGYPVPTKLPLTKAEEKSLKKIRRKIKNKISAQESRRKKKEYMDQLERRVEDLAEENRRYRRRMDNLSAINARLSSELRSLQETVARQEKNVTRSTPLATVF
ncbi:Basic-leucine zipper domain [Trinorchestia longiramus]|nr:Basic-leucine zipper domain [Trinorchestia longiramus]